MYYWPKIGRYIQASKTGGVGQSPKLEYCSAKINNVEGLVEGDNIDEIADTDWLCCTDDDGKTYKVRGNRFKCLFEQDIARYEFKLLTQNISGSIKAPFLFRGRILCRKEGLTETGLYELLSDGSLVPFTDIQYFPNSTTFAIIDTGSYIAAIHRPDNNQDVAFAKTFDNGVNWSSWYSVDTHRYEVETVYNNGPKIVIIYNDELHITVGEDGRGWQTDTKDFYAHNFDEATKSVTISTPEANTNAYSYIGCDRSRKQLNLGTRKKTYAYVPVSPTIVQRTSHTRWEYPSSWTNLSQAPTMQDPDWDWDDSPCINWSPSTVDFEAHIIDENNIITGYDRIREHYTHSFYRPDGSVHLDNIDSNGLLIYEVYNIFGGTYAVTPSGLAQFVDKTTIVD